jgi:hypothetical protein
MNRDALNAEINRRLGTHDRVFAELQMRHLSASRCSSLG